MVKKFIGIFGVIFTLGLLNSEAVRADQTGNCTAGSEYCEQNSLTTTNATTTTNTNNNNTTTTSTATNTNNNTSTSTATNTNNNVSTNTSTSSSSSVNQNTNTSTSTANNNNNNVNTSTSSNSNVNTNTSTSNVTSNVTNNNTSNVTSSNVNVNESTSSNRNVNESTSDNTNRNINESSSNSNVTTDNKNVNENNSTSNNTNRNINESKSEQTINQNITQKAPPASAIAPSIMSYSQDLCTVGRSGAFQGQVFGLSAGRTVRDENCERLKLGKYLYDMGMKVAAVAIMCQDVRVFSAMYMAGTPCPYEGRIGEEARLAWAANPKGRPDYKEAKSNYVTKCAGTENNAGQRKSRLTCKREFDSGG